MKTIYIKQEDGRMKPVEISEESFNNIEDKPVFKVGDWVIGRPGFMPFEPRRVVTPENNGEIGTEPRGEDRVKFLRHASGS